MGWQSCRKWVIVTGVYRHGHEAPNFSNFKVRHCVDRESNKIVYLVQKYNAKIEIAQNLISMGQF